MDDNSDTPLGVKMLADHLVKVKLQYEERINEMLVHIRNVEKEKDEMQKQYKVMEDELELRRNEIFQMKRENSSQYVIEERENWRAMLNQQKQINASLQAELNINEERVNSLRKQLDDIKNGVNVDSVVRDTVSLIPEKLSSENTVVSSDNNTTSLGPSQPNSAPAQGFHFDGSVESLQNEKKRLEEELAEVQDSIKNIEGDLQEAKQLNLKLTDQFIHRIDDLENDHKERENSLLSAIEAIKLKLDLELEKKWELSQELKKYEDDGSQSDGLFSFLW